MRRKNFASLLVVATLTFSSCIGQSAKVETGTNQNNGNERTNSKRQSNRAETALVDATGSYDQIVPALRRLARFAAEELDAGDTFCAFWIKGGIGESPDFIVSPTTLPVPQRRIGDPAQINNLELKRNIQKTFGDYAETKSFKKVGRTDLLQSIAYAGRLLHARGNASREKWLLLFTDLEDNQKKTVELNLQGVHVRVFYVPARNDLTGMETKMSSWKEIFSHAGASTVEIYDVGQSEMLPTLLDLGVN